MLTVRVVDRSTIWGRDWFYMTLGEERVFAIARDAVSFTISEEALAAIDRECEQARSAS